MAAKAPTVQLDSAILVWPDFGLPRSTRGFGFDTAGSRKRTLLTLYPFILLNLVFSTQAAYAAPLILLSQNRQADTDRITAEHDYEVNRLALAYLAAWHNDAHGQDCRCVREAAGSLTLESLTDPPGRPA